MADYQGTIKIGRPRKELSFTGDVDGLSHFAQRIGTNEKMVRNAAGEAFRRVFRKQDADFRVRLAFPVSDSIKNQLESMKLIADEPLSFYFADAWPVYSDRYTLDTTTTFKLSTSPYAGLGTAYKAAGGADTDIIAITGVFTDYDVAGGQVSTNYFTSGSYAAATRTVTLGSSPGAAGTVVYANWTYKGALVFMRPFQPQNRGAHVNGGGPLWAISLRLDGV